jgi:hypothetical protein
VKGKSEWHFVQDDASFSVRLTDATCQTFTLGQTSQETTMKITGNRNFIASFAVLLLGALGATVVHAQALDSLPIRNSETASSVVDTAAPETAPAAQDQAPAAPKPSSASDWHIDSTGYLWLAGVHGDLNAFDYNVGFKASPGDLLSHVDIGLMEMVGVRYKRLVLTSDFIWITLSDTKGRVLDRLPNAPFLSAEVKTRPVIFTQKVGYRLVDNKKIKIDGLAGFRFWHLGTTLTLTPSPFGNNPYTSRNWTDPLIGGRIQIPLSPKIVATIAGDVGGWGAGSQLEYQVVGDLAYRIKPKMALDLAWRYLSLDYSSRSNFSSQLALSGLVLGMTYTFKGAEPQ